MKETLEHGLLEFFSTYSYNESALSEIRDLFEAGKKDHFERTFLRCLETDIDTYAKKCLNLNEEVVKLLDFNDIAYSIRLRLESAEKQYKDTKASENKEYKWD